VCDPITVILIAIESAKVSDPLRRVSYFDVENRLGVTLA
jgi:hypothetical protein